MSDTHLAEDQQINGEDHSPDPAIERRARDMGWVPEHEWKGDPPKGGFRSAEEFVQRGEEVLPVVRSQLEKERKRASELEERLTRVERESADKITRMDRMTRVALEKQREQIVTQYEAKKEAAVEVGDRVAYREADKEQKAALADLDKRLEEPPEEKNKRETPQAPREITDWIAENRWFESDEEMKVWAIGYHGKLLKEKPGMSLSENLAEVNKKARKLFPEAFGTSEREEEDDGGERRGSRVEGGSRSFGAGSRSAWSRLPAEAKAQADKFIKEDGLFLSRGETVEKNLQAARERYAAQYLETEQ